MERRLIDGKVPTEDGEQFQLQWTTRLADMMRSIRRHSAHVMLALEDRELKDPNAFANDVDAKQLLRSWHDEGGREQFMGNITLEERRELESMVRPLARKKSLAHGLDVNPPSPGQHPPRFFLPATRHSSHRTNHSANGVEQQVAR